MNGPPPGNYCLACLMTAKQRQFEAHGGDIEQGYANGGDELTVIPWPPGLTSELGPAEYRAVCFEFAQLGVVDGLCWTHVAGINPSGVPQSALVPGVPGALGAHRRRH